MRNKLIIPIGKYERIELLVDYVKVLDYQKLEIKMSDDVTLCEDNYKYFYDNYIKSLEFPIMMKIEGEEEIEICAYKISAKENFLVGYEYYDWKRTFIVYFNYYKV